MVRSRKLDKELIATTHYVIRCQLCRHDLNMEDRLPMIGSCRHELCSICLPKLDVRDGHISCPFCRRQIDVNDYVIEPRILFALRFQCTRKLLRTQLYLDRTVHCCNCSELIYRSTEALLCIICLRQKALYGNSDTIFHDKILQAVFCPDCADKHDSVNDHKRTKEEASEARLICTMDDLSSTTELYSIGRPYLKQNVNFESTHLFLQLWCHHVDTNNFEHGRSHFFNIMSDLLNCGNLKSCSNEENLVLSNLFFSYVLKLLKNFSKEHLLDMSHFDIIVNCLDRLILEMKPNILASLWAFVLQVISISFDSLISFEKEFGGHRLALVTKMAEMLARNQRFGSSLSALVGITLKEILLVETACSKEDRTKQYINDAKSYQDKLRTIVEEAVDKFSRVCL